MIIPQDVEEILRQVESRGFEIFVVGGAIRDYLWGHPVVDWDLTTNAPLDELVKWFGSAHPGLRFGTVRAAPHVEITIMRGEGDYQRHRHPTAVVPLARVDDDLRRRDFTVNAVAMNRNTVHWVDHALEDLRDRRLRTVGDPDRRFGEDALRILRLVRLAAVYGCSIDPETGAGARRQRALLANISRERRLDEFLRFLRSPRAQWDGLYRLGLGLYLGLPDRPYQPGPFPEPRTDLARLFVFFRGLGMNGADMARWGETWPISRPWRRVLRHCGQEPDGDRERWAARARLAHRPDRLLWRDLAVSAGYEGRLDPEPLAVPTACLSERLDVRGEALGRLIRQLAETVADDPGKNRTAVLWRQARQWQKSREDDSRRPDERPSV